MGAIEDRYNQVYRDYATDGVKASGPYNPEKSEQRAIGPLIETAMANAALGALVAVTKATRADLNAELTHPADTVALVYADPDDANNDLYLKTGASGAGAWTLTTIFHSVFENLFGDLRELVDAVEARTEGLETTEISPDSGFLKIWRDEDGNLGFGLKNDGRLLARFDEECEFPNGLAQQIADLVGVSYSPHVALFGDSMTAQYDHFFAAEFPDRNAGGDAIGGHSAQEVAILQGGRCFPLTLAEDLPADTSAIDVLAFTGEDGLNVHMLSENDPLLYRDGTLAGIPVRVRWVGDGGDPQAFVKYTVERLSAGSGATTIADETPFILDNAVAMRGRTQVLWVGRNGAKNDRDDLRFIRNELIKMVEWIAPARSDYLVISVVNNSTETAGTAGYDTIMDLNRELEEYFGPHFVDLRSYMVNRAIYDAVSDGLMADPDAGTWAAIEADIAQDIVPTILMADTTHFSSPVGRTLSARFIERQLTARGK